MRATVAAVALAALLVACGGGGGGGTGQPAGSIKVSMTDFKFDPANVTAPHGKVVFYLVNNSSSTSHDMIVADSSGNKIAGSELISAGDSFVFSVDNLSAGSYVFYCDQPGHRAEGMQGTLTVT